MGRNGLWPCRPTHDAPRARAAAFYSRAQTVAVMPDSLAPLHCLTKINRAKRAIGDGRASRLASRDTCEIFARPSN